MSTPSRSEIEQQWKNVVDLLEESRKYGEVNAKNVIGMIDTIEQSLESDFLDEASSAIQAVRSAAAGIVSPSVAASLQRPFLKQYCKSVIGRTNLTSDSEMFDELYKYFQDNALRVQSRVFSFGTPTGAAGNIGNSQIVRLTKDQYNHDIENQFVDSKRAICVADQATGTQKGNEVWQVKGQALSRDDLERSGSGLEGQLVGLTTDDSLLFNASFTQFSGSSASAPDSITDWTMTGTFSLDSTNFFRAAPSDQNATSYALKLESTASLSQLLSLRNTKLDPNKPYLLRVMWNRQVGSASGTLVVRMGNRFTSVAVAAQTGWQATTVPNPIGQSAWYRQFAEDSMNIDIIWTRTGGNLLIDDVLFVEGTEFDGSWYWVLPTSVTAFTPHRRLDEFTWADSAVDSKIQKWLWRGFNRYLPSSNGSSITFADP